MSRTSLKTSEITYEPGGWKWRPRSEYRGEGMMNILFGTEAIHARSGDVENEGQVLAAMIRLLQDLADVWMNP